MKQEYESLRENDTWTLVDRPKGSKILSNRWVFKIKRKLDGNIERYKARLVVRGNEQREGIDFKEVFAPVARLETIRTFLAACVQKKMHVHQMDVVTAYVQGDLFEDIYMNQPDPFTIKGQEDKVCLLKRPLYGLKQSGREWYRKLHNYLSSIGLKRTETDPCVYVDIINESDLVIIVYVDDLLIGSRDINKLNERKKKLQQKFKMNDLGPISSILGIHVERDGPTGNLKLSQTRYANDLLKKFGMFDCKSVATPIESNTKVSKEDGPKSEQETREMEDKPYRELVGGLIYLANATRPDLSFAASVLSRFCSKPGIVHWQLAKRVLRYIKGTLKYGITYEKDNKNMHAYVDADWGSDIDDRRSYTGSIIILAKGPISWQAKKQRSVALSTMEAEYMGLSEVMKETIYLKGLLRHMKFTDCIDNPTIIYCDNQSAIHLSKNAVNRGRSKHIDLRYHFVKEIQEKGEIEISYIRTDSMTADILTKSLPKIKHNRCVKQLRLPGTSIGGVLEIEPTLM